MDYMHQLDKVLFEIAAPMGLTNPATLKKMQDLGRPELTGHSGNTSLPSRSGNQNTAIANPRHRQFFNAPPDGGSLETRSGRANGSVPVKDTRPRPSRFNDTEPEDFDDEVSDDEAQALAKLPDDDVFIGDGGGF